MNADNVIEFKPPHRPLRAKPPTVTVECRRCGYIAEAGDPNDLFTIDDTNGSREIRCPNPECNTK